MMAIPPAELVVDWATNAFIIAGVAWPYIPQARQIWATKNHAGFSLSASLIIIAANTMRVAYWFGARFTSVFLVQSLVAILAQLCMIGVVTAAARSAEPERPRRSICSRESSFWAWSDLGSFVAASALFAAALAALQLLLGGQSWYVESLGVAALGLEALLPLPQAVRNFQRKSTAGLSTLLIVAWLGGDVFKTLISLQRAAPWPFVACGLFQGCVDLIILAQIFLFADDAKSAGAKA